MIQESIYLEDDKKRISLGNSKSAFTPRYPDLKDFCTFNPAHSQIIRENSIPINNLQVRQSLMASINVRQMQMQQVHPDKKSTQIIEEVQIEFDGFQQIDYRVAESFDPQISQDQETGFQQQSAIIQSCFLMQPEKFQVEGWLLKGSKSLLWPFKRRYCVFFEGILSVYKDDSKKRAQVVLNFHLFNFKYFSKSEGNKCIEFGLKCEADDKVFTFKGEDADKWYHTLTGYISQYRLKPKQLYYIHPFPEYYKKRIIHNQQFIDMAQTGDIILFQGKHISCKMQRAVTRSEYDHVAMVLKYTNGNIYILEATGTFGVGIFAWEHMITKQWYELYNKVVYRQLEMKKTIEFLQKLETFTRENLGKAYKLTVSKLLTDKSVLLSKSSQQTYFCSQLIAQAYKRAGILQTELSSTQFWPGSFSNEKDDIKLTGAKLSDEYVIGFNM